MQKKVYIETLGCQMNKSDSEIMLGILETLGYEETDSKKEADLLIMNTCSIRAMSENKAFSHLGVWNKKFKKIKPHIKIAVCGCVAQQTKEKIFQRAPYVDLIFGTHNIYELPNLLQRLEKEPRVCSILTSPFEGEKEDFEPKREKGLSAWLPIIEGCDYFCTYCVVPYTRGRQRSRNPGIIIKEAQNIAKDGFREITLLGQTVDSYGNDFEDENINLSYLLREINKIDGLYRIRFMTSHPSDITDELIQTVKELEKVCEYFHIPMQSGNNEILQKMRRPYTREEYIALIEKIKNAMPDVAVTSDFIAGFPGETDEQFQDTLSIIDEMEFDHCNTAAYSPRKQTPAAVWKNQLTLKVKKDRLNILNDKVKENVKKSNVKYENRTLEVLVEDYKIEDSAVILSGRTRNNKIVHFEGDKTFIGTLQNVFITDGSAWCLKGRL